jgi:benzodiazapine receptor
MRSDTVRQVITILAFLAVMVSNIAANALPINGITTREISDRFAVYVIPAGYVFSIWGLIYLLQGAFTTWQALPRNRESAVLRSLGFLPALSGVLNTTWILLFQYEVFALTVPVIVAFLVTLIAIHLRLWAHRDELRGTTYWTVRAPWSVYLGWVTVATIANIAQSLAWAGFTGFGLEPALLAGVVLAVGAAIAVTFVNRFRDVAYGLVIVWAYAGVAVKEAGTPVVLAAAVLGAALVGLLVVAALVRGRSGGATHRVGASAAT